ncbi:ChaN family lipoprotein, partial [Parvimonas micra]|uniref:ChaN family lipoprotein n=1 Tax=Parvimonas micra TaxID=33033 RepID=UPI003979635F
MPVSLVGGQRVELEAGHCGKMPSDLMPGMIRAQIARDVWMETLIARQAGHAVVLLAGNAHVRRDLGVPHWLSA